MTAGKSGPEESPVVRRGGRPSRAIKRGAAFAWCAAVGVLAPLQTGTDRQAATGGVAPGGSAPALQARAGVDVSLPAPPSVSAEGPAVRVSRVLNDNELQKLVHEGFPARLHFRVELWSIGRWVDDLERKTEWDVYVRFDPLQKLYRVVRVVGDQIEPVGQSAEYAEVVATVERPYRAPIKPGHAGRRYYYNAVLDVEVLSVSDIDELEQWLRGELRPLLQGKKNPATALTRGARTLLVRLLGGEKRQYVQKTGAFRAPAAPRPDTDR